MVAKSNPPLTHHTTTPFPVPGRDPFQSQLGGSFHRVITRSHHDIPDSSHKGGWFGDARCAGIRRRTVSIFNVVNAKSL